MAVFSVHVYRAHDGRGLDMIGQMVKAKTILEANGAIASLWQTQTGGEPGTIAFVDAYDGPGSYGRTMDAVGKSDEWNALVNEIVTAPTGANVDNYRLQDVDPLATLPTVVSTVLHQILHRPLAGRSLDFFATSATALGHLTRLGAQARLMQVVGRAGGSYATILGFEDFTHYGEFGEKVAVDEQWTTFWGGVLADPPAVELESGAASLIQLPA